MMAQSYPFEACMTMTAVKPQAHNRIHNFSAGPSALPLPVLEQIQKEMLNLPGAGASILEISHRSAEFTRIIEEAEADLKKLLGIPAGYKVMFLQGGASQQFAMIPMNLASKAKVGYLVTGSWGSKALKEAKGITEASALWSGKEGGFSALPTVSDYTAAEDLAYVHYTSNETIQGVQFQNPPSAGSVPLICDMSSDFVSRPVDVSQYGLIYAGAQKNVGPAGMTVVVVREDLLARTPEALPTIFKYATHSDAGSCYNTPPVFAIYAAGLVFKWLLKTYGDLAGVAQANNDKAALIYAAIDNSEGFYKPHAAKDCRSPMNITWVLADDKLQDDFLKEAKAQHLIGLKGHRSVGGMRASLYNAVPKESAQALAAFMDGFRKKHS
jgi:phosphoserine aminotransferase